MGALHFPSPRMKPHSLRHGHVLPHVILQALALKKGGKVRRGAGVLRLKGRTINAPRLVVSLLRLACLVQRVPQFVLLVLRQLSMPVGVPCFRSLCRAFFLVSGQLLVPSYTLVPHFSVVAETGQILVLSLSEQRSEERLERPTCASRVTRTRCCRGGSRRNRRLCIDRPSKRR